MNIDKGIALHNQTSGTELVTFPQEQYTQFSALSPVGKRKMLRKMQQRIPLAKMNYAQAKLFHRLKGRIGK